VIPSLDAWLPVLVVAASTITGIAIAPLRDEQVRARTILNLAGALAKLALVAVIFQGFLRDHEYESRLALVPGFDFVLRVDAISLLFAVLSSVLWLVTTIYAIGYLEGSPHRSRFFAFFSFSVAATMGIALAGNLLTFFVFYEALTLATYPLVIHRGTQQALAAGRTYLAYTLAGGAVLLVGVGWTQAIAGPVEFQLGGALDAVAEGRRAELIVLFGVLIVGVGVKAALVPLHGWLPIAMVAPAPVSALLHAVAVVKAGAYGIVRIVYELYGLELAVELGVLAPLAAAAALTIVWGSVRALAQDELKRRLAFSTVSQVSYITLGVATFGPLASIGALVHLIHQGLMKITLFFCAGNIAETLGLHRISELGGIGRRMPLTMAAFTVAAFGMVGVPPVAGFVSKWYLGSGAVEAGELWVLAILGVSGVLNAAYFLPIVYAAWFRAPTADWEQRKPGARAETSLVLLVPCLATAAMALLAGLLAASPISPLELASWVTEALYAP
jgi:multicomponent Na+:H+ antiporter subunit D